MSKYTKREKCCNLCHACINDCKEIEEITECKFFKKGINRHEYDNYIKDMNINVRKLCDSYNVSYNTMMKMLSGRMLFNYKYATILNSRIFELEEYLPYVEKFDNKDVANG